MSLPYVLIGIGVLALIGGLFASGAGRGGSKRLSPLAGFAFTFVLAGLLFDDNRLIGYGLFGVGVLLAVVDIVLKGRRGGV